MASAINMSQPDESVRVAVRIRPFNIADGGVSERAVKVEEGVIHTQHEQGDRIIKKQFNYDHIIDGDNEECYNTIGKPMVEEAVAGYNVCMFAYGQTGSGKTHSMMGSQSDHGILYRLFDDLVTACELSQANQPNLTCKITLSFVEVYKEKVYDLLKPTSPNETTQPGLSLKQDKKGWDVVDVIKPTVMSLKMVDQIIAQGIRRRRTNATAMNPDSSRSHSIVTFTLSQVLDPPDPATPDKESKIQIVDLAGSERQGKTSISDPKLLRESEFINKSLLTLSKCLRQSSESASHLPVRESVLTKLLCNVFGGNSKAVMLATISPSSRNIQESLSTLQYALTAKLITQHAMVNVNNDRRFEIHELKNIIQMLREELAEADQKSNVLEQENLFLRSEIKNNKHNHTVHTVLTDDETESNTTTTGTSTSVLESQCVESGISDETFSNNTVDNTNSSPNHVDPVLPNSSCGRKKRSAPIVADRSKSNLCSSFSTNLISTSERIYWDHENHSSHYSESDLSMLQSELQHKLRSKEQIRKNYIQLDTSRGSTQPFSPLSTYSSDEVGSGKLFTKAVDVSKFTIQTYKDTESLYSVSLSNNGATVITCGKSNILRSFNTLTGVELWAVQLQSSGRLLSCEAISDNVLCGSSDGRMWGVRIADGKINFAINHRGFLYSLKANPQTHKCFLSCSSDGSLLLWSMKGERIQTITQPTQYEPIYSISWSGDGSKVCSAGYSSHVVKVFVVSQTSLSFKETLEGHTDTVWCANFHPAGKLIISCSKDKTARLWTSKSSQFKCTSVLHHDDSVQSATFVSSSVAMTASGSSISIWNTVDSSLIRCIPQSSIVYQCVTFGSIALSCTADGIAKLWKISL